MGHGGQSVWKFGHERLRTYVILQNTKIAKKTDIVKLMHVREHILYTTVTRNHGRKQQDAQLSQRDRAAGCVIVFAKSRTLELGDNDLRTL